MSVRTARSLGIGRLAPTALHADGLIPGDADFAELDAAVAALNVAPPTTMQEVVLALQPLVREDAHIDAVRAVYVWITQNIHYNAAGYYSGNYGDNTSPGVLQHGMAVCAGYSRLFRELLSNINEAVHCDIVSGHAGSAWPGTLSESDLAVSDTREWNHAWNIVRLGDRFALIDTTWGAGFLDGAKFVHEPSSAYFLINPQLVIFSHFPEEPEKQLLAEPISKDKHKMLPVFQRRALREGFRTVSHHTREVTTDENGTAVLRYALPSEAKAQWAWLLQLKRAGSRNSSEYPVFGQWEDDEFVVRVQCPDPGTFVLRLFGAQTTGPSATAAESLSYDFMFAQFIVATAMSPSAPMRGFPKLYSLPHAKKGIRFPRIAKPLAHKLSPGENMFEVFVADIAGVTIRAASGSDIPLIADVRTPGRYRCTATLRAGPVNLYISYSNDNLLYQLASFVVE